MRTFFVLSVLASLGSFAAPAAAQMTLTHDTIAGDTNVSIFCGFCAGEKYGVVFRDLPSPMRGLNPSDFPIEIENVQVALANASVSSGGTCIGEVNAATIEVGIEIWGGITPPDDLDELPADGPWGGPDNEMLLIQTTTPVSLSTADGEGSTRYEAQFNSLSLVEEDGRSVRIDAPFTYIRVVVALNGGAGMSAACDDLGLDPPGAMPITDQDGVIEDHRSFLYSANDEQWFWNEDARLRGDWAIRLEYSAGGSSTVDAGPRDAGRRDSGVRDAGTDSGDMDSGMMGDDDDDDDGGCSCTVPTPRRDRFGALSLLGIGIVISRLTRRMRRWGR